MHRSLRFSNLILGGLLLAGCGGDDKADPNPETSIGALQPDVSGPLDKAFASLGGKAALMNLKGLRYETTGQRYVLNEGLTPDEVTRTTSYTTTRILAASGDKMRLETERQIDFIGITANNEYVEIVNGNAGFLEGDEGLATGFAAPDRALTAARVAAVKKQQWLLNPQLLLAMVARGEGTATSAGVDLVDGQLQQVIEIAGIRFFIDASSGQVTKLSTLEDVSPFKDAEVEVFFDGWMPGSGTDLMFPMLAAIATAGERVLVESRGVTTALAELDETQFQFQLPMGAPAFSNAEATRGMETQSALSQPQALGIPFRDALQQTVTPTEVAPGVWHLTGGSHHSMVVEQAAGYVLVEAPLDPFRTLAITTWAAAQFPGKGLTHVINTHHHEDHSAGVRQAVGVGARLVAGQGAAEFWQRVLNAPATVVADSLASGRPRTSLDLVAPGRSLVLPDATHPVTAYAISNCHASDMLVIGVGDIMFTSDLVSPGNGAPLCPFSETLGALQAQSFNPQLIVGGHGGTVAVADFQTQFPD